MRKFREQKFRNYEKFGIPGIKIPRLKKFQIRLKKILRLKKSRICGFAKNTGDLPKILGICRKFRGFSTNPEVRKPLRLKIFNQDPDPRDFVIFGILHLGFFRGFHILIPIPESSGFFDLAQNKISRNDPISKRALVKKTNRLRYCL